MPCVVGLFLTNIVAIIMGLEKPQAVTLSVECSYQNIAIATTAVFSIFGQNPIHLSQALAVPLFYGFVEIVFVGMYCMVVWKLGWTYAPTDASLCKVMCETYGPEKSYSNPNFNSTSSDSEINENGQQENNSNKLEFVL